MVPGYTAEIGRRIKGKIEGKGWNLYLNDSRLSTEDVVRLNCVNGGELEINNSYTLLPAVEDLSDFEQVKDGVVRFRSETGLTRPQMEFNGSVYQIQDFVLAKKALLLPREPKGYHTVLYGIFLDSLDTFSESMLRRE